MTVSDFVTFFTLLLSGMVVLTVLSVIHYYYKAWRTAPSGSGVVPLHVWLVATGQMLFVLSSTFGILKHPYFDGQFMLHILGAVISLIALQVIGSLQIKRTRSVK